MIGGTERDAERAEELTRKVPEPLGIVFGSPGRGVRRIPESRELSRCCKESLLMKLALGTRYRSLQHITQISRGAEITV